MSQTTTTMMELHALPLPVMEHVSYPLAINAATIPQADGVFDMLTPPNSQPRHCLSFPTYPIPYGLPTPPMNENSPPTKAEKLGDNRRDSIQSLTLEPVLTPQSTVNILVEFRGKLQAFIVHRDLLCFYSLYFRKLIEDSEDCEVKKKAMVKSGMLRREWRWESEDDLGSIDCVGFGEKDKVEVDVTIKLPPGGPLRAITLNKAEVGGVTRMVFAAFVDWLYRGFDGFGLDPYSDRQIDASTLIQLWVFAGKVGVPACQNDCIEGIEMWRQNSGIVQTEELSWVYENTKEYTLDQCKLKKLLIDQCAWKLDGDWVTSGELSTEEQFPRMAMVDMMAQMRHLLTSGAYTLGGPPFARLEWRRSLYWLPVVDVDGKIIAKGIRNKK